MRDFSRYLYKKLSYIAQWFIGWLLIVLGILAVPLPIPVGLLLIVLGVLWLATLSTSIRQVIIKHRQRHLKISQKIDSLKHRVPARLRTIIEETAPKKDERCL